MCFRTTLNSLYKYLHIFVVLLHFSRDVTIYSTHDVIRFTILFSRYDFLRFFFFLQKNCCYSTAIKNSPYFVPCPILWLHLTAILQCSMVCLRLETILCYTLSSCASLLKINESKIALLYVGKPMALDKFNSSSY